MRNVAALDHDEEGVHASRTTNVSGRGYLRLLVVEDDPTFAEILCGGIVDHDGSVRLRRVGNLPAAIRHLSEETFDAVLLDLGLPDSVGLDTLKRVLDAEPRIPVVVLTGADEKVMARQAIEMGAQDFLEKGRVPPGSILRSVRYAVTRSRLRWQISDLVQANLDAMMVVDSRGQVRLANAAAEGLFGQGLVGRRSPVTLAGRGRFEVRIGAGREPRRTLEVQATTVRWEDEDSVLASIRDVTEIRRAQELERRLQHADRLAAIGQLAAGVAHEVNNPAAFIHANLEALARDVEATGGTDNTHARALIADCLAGIERISEIVQELAGFARLDDDRARPVDLCEVARSACTMASSTLRHSATLELDLHPLPTIVGDATKLVQVVLNLVVNAADAIKGAGGTDNRVLVETRHDDEWVMLAVEDTGPGIPDHLQNRIFEPFYTSKPPGKGTGLGLAISADTIHAHGGTLEVQSAVGVGTRFEIRLPRDHGREPASEDSGAHRIVLPPPRRLRVLVVDDEAMLRRAFQRLIGAMHETVTTDGPGALELLRRDPRFDVIVCDLMMPDVDGPELYERVTEEHPKLASRFVFLTGGVFTDRARTFLERHDFKMLRKPVPQKELLSAIHEIG